MYEKKAGVRDASLGCRGGSRGAAYGERRGRKGGAKPEGVGRARGGDRRRARDGSLGRGRKNSNREFSKKEASEVSGRARLNLILPDSEVVQLSSLSSSARSDLLEKVSSRFFFLLLFIVVVVVVEARCVESSIWGYYRGQCARLKGRACQLTVRRHWCCLPSALPDAPSLPPSLSPPHSKPTSFLLDINTQPQPRFRRLGLVASIRVTLFSTLSSSLGRLSPPCPTRPRPTSPDLRGSFLIRL